MLGEDSNVKSMTFLKPYQVDTSLIRLEETPLQCVSLNSTVTQVIGINEDLSQSIRQALPNDPQIGPYLGYLEDDGRPQEECVTEYLKPFSLHKDGLVLHNGLVYVPEDDSIKLQILKMCHDSTTAGHLGQAKTLEIVSCDYFWLRM